MSGQKISDNGKQHTLLATSIERYRSDLMTVGGELVCTTQRLTFQPRALERAIWKSLELDLAIEDISRVSWSARRVEIECAGEVYRFAGPHSAALYAALVALEDARAIHGSTDEILFVHFAASRHSGPIASPGLFFVTVRRMGFLLTGALDKLTGMAGRTEVLFDNVSGIRLHQERLEIQRGDTSWQFSMPQLEEQFDAILQAIAQSTYNHVDRAHDDQLKDALTPWAGSLQDPVLAAICADDGVQNNQMELQLAGPCLLVDARLGVRAGWLMLTSRYLTFLPNRAVHEKGRPLALPTIELQRARTDDTPPGEILIERTTAPLRLIPGAGAGFVQGFWTAVEHVRGEILHPTPSSAGFNRRDTYRVWIKSQMSRTVTVEHRVEDGSIEGFEAKLVDLSLGGCALIAHRPLADLDQVRLRIPLVPDDYEETVEDELAASASVRPPDFIVLAYPVHERRLPNGRTWRCGMTFGKLRGKQRQRARSAWMSFQREEAGGASWDVEEDGMAFGASTSITDSGEFAI